MQHAVQLASQSISQGRFDQAIDILNKQLNTTPYSEDCLALLGHALLGKGAINESLVAFENLVSLFPESANGHAELANAYLAANQKNKAISHFRKAVDISPQYAEVWHILGNLLMQTDNIKEANKCFQQAEKYDPFRQQMMRIMELMNANKFHDAEKLARTILQQHPNHTHALFTLAKLAEQVDAAEQAINILQKALQYAPYHISVWQSLSKNFAHLGHFDKAIEAAKKVVKYSPENYKSYVALGVELANACHFEESIQAYNKAIALAPDIANTYLLLGHTQKTLGYRESCERSYEKSIELDYNNGTAFWALADLKSYQFSNEQITHMETLLNNENIDPAQRCQASFALAKYYEDAEQYELAFSLYKRANKLRPHINFCPGSYKTDCEDLIQAFGTSHITTQAPKKYGDATPIFIVGLTRSGSTLIEQILASHSQIEGTMELYSLPRVVRLAEKRCQSKGLSFPKDINELSEHELEALGQHYLNETAVFRTNKPYFIDKLPPNFHNVGLIHKILPNAIIIDARRHPLSTGFSNYKQHFANGYDFTYNLSHIGEYYNQYLSVMDHWDKVLPNKVL